MGEDEEKKEGIWNFPDFERYPKVELKSKGDEVIVGFEDDGKMVSAETLKKVMKEKKIPYTPRDSIVFVVTEDDEKKELWISATNYSALKELKTIRAENNDDMTGAIVRITRIAENQPNEPNYTFEKAQ